MKKGNKQKRVVSRIIERGERGGNKEVERGGGGRGMEWF